MAVGIQPLEVYAVRHGETTWNRAGRIQGQKNTGLTELGRQQAQELREDILDLDFDQVFSSDLRRCRETTDLVIQGRDLPVGYSKRFRERGFGRLEGLSWNEARRRHPDLIKSRGVQASLMPELEIEDHDTTFRTRVLEGLARLQKRYPEARRILLITHGGVIKVLLREAEGNKTFMVSNCGLYRFQVTGTKLTLLRNS